MNRIVLMLSVLLCLSAVRARATDYYVAPHGNDSGPGTRSRPFASIQKAADKMSAGDTCVIRAGTYRQAVVLDDISGQPGKPIRFRAAKGERVVLDGTEPIQGRWSPYTNAIYKAPLDEEDVSQLFVDGRMQIEARWPNIEFGDLLKRERWAKAGPGSCYGTMVDSNLATTAIDWTGALATLNVAHQWSTWWTFVASHEKGSDTFTYEKKLGGIANYANKPKRWEDDYYYLTGKLEALDAPAEWFHDTEAGLLYLRTDDGRSPAGRRAAYKKRIYAFDASGCAHLEFAGLDFFACTFRLAGCSNSVVDSCRLLFPTCSRRKRPGGRTPRPVTTVRGDDNIVRNTGIAYASHTGLDVTGNRNVVENCIIHDTGWSGKGPVLRVTGEWADAIRGNGNIVRRNTLYNGEGVILYYRGGSHLLEYNHVFNGGLLTKDVALVYTSTPLCAGSIVRYNWVHGCQTDPFIGRGKDGGGIGIRGDDMSRELTVHHNVVWDCGMVGIIVKGDNNNVYNNTVFGVGPADTDKRHSRYGGHLLIPTRAEPKKAWAKWQEKWPLLKVQNANSFFINNAVCSITWRNKPLPDSPRIANNPILPRRAEEWLRDPANLDFRPGARSPLTDAGIAVQGLTGSYKGKAPDVGAYEHNGRFWKPGADWQWADRP